MIKGVKKKTVSAIVLAGGESQRMGYPKPWLPYDESNSFLQRIINVFMNAGVNDIVTVLNSRYASSYWDEELNGVRNNSRIELNNESEKGRLYSLCLGLTKVDSEYIIIHNVDNPFIEKEIITALIKSVKADVVIPVYNGLKGHPVRISRSVKNEIVNAWNQYLTLKDVFCYFNIDYLDVASKSVLSNLNSPEDYMTALHELDS